MKRIPIQTLGSLSDDDVFSLLRQELELRLTVNRDAPEFLAALASLPAGLRAMAATYELDVSLSLDDLGWHFGNWHSRELAEETAWGLDELGATELAKIFRAAFLIAQDYWTELGDDNWTRWYHGSPLEKAVQPLTDQAWALLKPKPKGILTLWVEYARRHPDRVGVWSPL